MSVSRQDVINCYHYILGREPESEQVITNHMSLRKDLLDCQKVFYGCTEYRSKHPRLETESRMSPLGGVETIGLLCEPDSCPDGLKYAEVVRLYHEAVRQGNPCLMVVDAEGHFQGKLIDRLSLAKGEKGKPYIRDGINYVVLGSGNEWKKAIFKIWDKWHNNFPDVPYAPLVQDKKLVGYLYRLHDGSRYLCTTEHMDIDRELFRLISKYGIYREEPDLLDYYYYKYKAVFINELFDSLPTDGAIALEGVSDDTKAILECLTEENRMKVSFILDVAEGVEDIGLATTINPSKLYAYDIRTVVLTTYANRENAKKILRDGRRYLRVVDCYDYLRKNGVLCGERCGREKESFYATNYVDVNNALCDYEKSVEGEKPFYLRRLIAYCVDIKNFIFMERYIEIYLEQNYEQKEIYQGFLKEFRQLLERIKCCLRERAQEDFIIDWVDATTAEEFYRTEFAKSIERESIFFTKAYTNTPWTGYTYNNIFLGKLPISGKVYGGAKFDAASSPLLREVNEHGYEFRFVANPGLYDNRFPPESYVYNGDGRVKANMTWGRAWSDCSSRLQWLALGERLKSDKPLFIWIHDLSEVHPPCAFISSKNKMSDMDRHLKGLDHLAEQLSFYAQFRSKQQHNIYLDDHGPHLGIARQHFWGDKATHISMIVRSPKIRPGKMDKLYSHVDFIKVIRELMGNGSGIDLYKISSSYVLGEVTDYRDSKAIDADIASGNLLLMRFQQAFVRTEEDIYVCYPLLGKEIYCRGTDENTNLIDSPKWQERIKHLRGLAPKEYIDIKVEDGFKESKRLYEFFKTIPPEKIEW